MPLPCFVVLKTKFLILSKEYRLHLVFNYKQKFVCKCFEHTGT